MPIIDDIKRKSKIIRFSIPLTGITAGNNLADLLIGNVILQNNAHWGSPSVWIGANFFSSFGGSLITVPLVAVLCLKEVTDQRVYQPYAFAKKIEPFILAATPIAAAAASHLISQYILNDYVKDIYCTHYDDRNHCDQHGRPNRQRTAWQS